MSQSCDIHPDLSGPVTYLYFRYPADIQRGIVLLEELYKHPDETGNRDFIYYLAVGNARLKVNQSWCSSSNQYKVNYLLVCWVDLQVKDIETGKKSFVKKSNLSPHWTVMLQKKSEFLAEFMYVFSCLLASFV